MDNVLSEKTENRTKHTHNPTTTEKDKRVLLIDPGFLGSRYAQVSHDLLTGMLHGRSLVDVSAWSIGLAHW